MSLRNLPSVDKILSDGRFVKLAGKYPHELLVGVIREQLDIERAMIANGKESHN